MKNKTIIKSKKEFMKWIYVSNLLAKSMISPDIALKQFNRLNATQRIKIKQFFDKYDKIRRIKIPKGEVDSAWELSVMVDAHIIATEFDIDPLTAIMCITPLCKANEQIIFK